MKTGAPNWVAAIRDELDEFKVPSVLRQQAALQATQGWPPKPGCCESPSYHGVPRLWADFPLAEWVAITPGVLGYITVQEAAALDEIANRLRRSGEGAHALWGLDLQGRGFEPNDLVCFGPRLPDEVLADVEELFATRLGGHKYGHLDAPNEPTAYNRVSCYETIWMYGVLP
jgi:hypothetical protein